MVGERHARLESCVHARAVHAVEQCLHKPSDIQIRYFPSAFFFAVFTFKYRNLGYCFGICGVRVFLQRKDGQHAVFQEHGTRGEVHGPREAVGVEAFLLVEPRITAKDFVGALPCERHLVVCGDSPAEVEHRCLHVRHAWQIPGIDRLEQVLIQIRVGTFKVLVVCAAVGDHQIHPRSVLGGLEGICPEILVVVLEVKGVCVEPLTLLLKLAAAYRCDKTAVHTARQEGTDGHIGEHLHPDGVCDQIPGFLDCALPVVFMWITLQFPIALCGKVPGKIGGVIFEIMSRKQLIYVFKNTLSVGLCRAKTEDLTEPVAVGLRLKVRKAQDPLQLGGKDEGVAKEGIEQWLYPESVAEQI